MLDYDSRYEEARSMCDYNGVRCDANCLDFDDCNRGEVPDYSNASFNGDRPAFEQQDVYPEDACPNCGESRIDWLAWIDDVRVRCESCGEVYFPPSYQEALP